jgi:hypothetical protein
MNKSLSYYLYEARQKKKELRELEKQLLVLKAENGNFKDNTEAYDKYKSLLNRRTAIKKEIHKLRKEAGNFIINNPEYKDVPDKLKYKLVVSE